MVKVVDLDKLYREKYDDNKVTGKEKRIRRGQPRSGSNLEGRILPVVNEEGQPKHSARKDWQWKPKNAAPGPITVIKYQKENK